MSPFVIKNFSQYPNLQRNDEMDNILEITFIEKNAEPKTDLFFYIENNENGLKLLTSKTDLRKIPKNFKFLKIP